MARSMTGYGQSEKVTKDYKISVEIKAVNHRYSDINIKMPKKFNAMENDIRTILKEYIARGKVDVFISYVDYTAAEENVEYHANVARGYMDAIAKAAEEFGVEQMISASSIVRFPEVITLREVDKDEEQLYPIMEENLREAAEKFVAARTKEGEHLKKDLFEKLDYIEELVTKVEERAPGIIEEYRKKITDKVAELLGDKNVDERVLASEIILFADKVCVDEETVRLRSHIKNMKDTLLKEESIGRKLDFIAQEMNREANTILSKANDREVSAVAIDLKTEIEKVREQIQNIE